MGDKRNNFNLLATSRCYPRCMSASYSFDVDPLRNLVRITLTGFFTVRDIADFIARRDEAHCRLRCGSNQHLTLVDVRGMHIQSQESVQEFQRMLSDPRAAGKRIAFIVAQSLARMQAQRAAEGRVAEYFTMPDEAEAWLFSGQAAAA